MAFHGMVYLTMPIDFTYSMLLLAILFWRSPFQRPEGPWRAFLGTLPLLGWCAKRRGVVS